MAGQCFESPDVVKYSLLKLKRLNKIKKMLSIDPGDRVLDVGCGGGFFSFYISTLGAEVTGVDVEKRNINLCRQFYPNKSIKWIIADAIELPFPDNSFDKILCMEVLEHIPDDKKSIAEIYRVLRKGGIALFSTPCTNPSFSLIRIKKLFGVDMSTDFGHVRGGYSNIDLKKILEKQNFKIIQKTYFSYFFTEVIYLGIYLVRRFLSIKKDNWSGSDLNRLNKRKIFLLYKILLPVFIVITTLEDKIFYNLRGHHLLFLAKK